VCNILGFVFPPTVNLSTQQQQQQYHFLQTQYFLAERSIPANAMKRTADVFSFIDVLCKGTVVYAIWLIIPCLVKLLLNSLTFLNQNGRELNMNWTVLEQRSQNYSRH
jgi:hypothetical protein